VDGPGDAAGGLAELVGGVRGVTEDEAGRAGAFAVPGQRVSEHPGLLHPPGEIRVVEPASQPRQRDQQMEAGRDALDTGPGQVLTQPREQGVTTAALPVADQPDVVFEVPAAIRRASTSCGSAGVPRSLACFAATMSACSHGGGTSQPRRMPGASVLETLPA
jgi:hypothetical protein